MGKTWVKRSNVLENSTVEKRTIVWSPPSVTILGCRTPSFAGFRVSRPSVSLTTGRANSEAYATSICSMASLLSYALTGTCSHLIRTSRSCRHKEETCIPTVYNLCSHCVWISSPRESVSAVITVLTSGSMPDSGRTEARARTVGGCGIERHPKDGNIKGLIGVLETFRVGQVRETKRSRVR
jgi:hypothetical protein